MNSQLHQLTAEQEIKQIAPDIPDNRCALMVQILAGAGLLNKVGFSIARRMVLPNTDKYALVIPMPEVPPFQPKPPFGGKTAYTWALDHGTGTETAKAILLQPADWTFGATSVNATFPHLGHSFLGTQLGRVDQCIPDYAVVELLDRASTKGKGQLPILFGLIYRECISTSSSQCWRK